MHVDHGRTSLYVMCTEVVLRFGKIVRSKRTETAVPLPVGMQVELGVLKPLGYDPRHVLLETAPSIVTYSLLHIL